MDLCTRSLPRSAFTSLRDEATVDLDRDDGGLWSSRAPSAPSAWHGVEEPARLPEALRCLPDKAARGPKVSLRRGRASLPAKPDDAPAAVPPLLEQFRTIAASVSQSSFSDDADSSFQEESSRDSSFQDSTTVVDGEAGGALPPPPPPPPAERPSDAARRRLSPSEPVFLVGMSVPMSPQRPDSPSSPQFLVGGRDAAASPTARSNLALWLEARGLGKYAAAIQDLGARKVSDLCHLGDDDLDDMGMSREERVNVRVTVG